MTFLGRGLQSDTRGSRLATLSAGADAEQTWALKALHYKSDWFQSELSFKVITPIKKLRF